MHLVRLRNLIKPLSIVFLSLLSVPIWAADAEAPAPVIQAPPAPRFDISEFKVDGDTILGADTIKALVKPFIGPSKDFGDVQQALEALQDAYQARGFSAVHVNLPDQELESGVVHFIIVEQKVSSIKVEGNENYSEASVLRAVPSLQEGSAPNTKSLSRTLKVANENPTKQTAVLFSDNEEDENSVDATVKVVDDKPWKAFATLDNTGSRETGWGRISLGYQNFNLFDTDQRLTAQFITNPHYPMNMFNPEHKVYVTAIGYTIPLTSIGDSIDLIAAYSDTTSSSPVAIGVLGSISGKGLVLGAHYNHNFDKSTDFEHKLNVGFDSRATRASTSSLGVLTPAITTTPISVTYSGQWSPSPQTIAFSAGFSRNIAGIAEHGNKDDFVNSGNFDSTFNKFNFSLDYVRPLQQDWQFHAGFSSQVTWDSLVSIEKFRVGGADSVRGFHESEMSGDEGYRITMELITADFGKVTSDKASLRGIFFTDIGRVSDIHTLSTPATQTSVASVGAGLRYNYSTHVVGRIDVADVINGNLENGGSTDAGNLDVHFSVGYIW